MSVSSTTRVNSDSSRDHQCAVNSSRLNSSWGWLTATNTDGNPVLVYCWASVSDSGRKITQHRLNASRLPGRHSHTNNTCHSVRENLYQPWFNAGPPSATLAPNLTIVARTRVTPLQKHRLTSRITHHSLHSSHHKPSRNRSPYSQVAEVWWTDVLLLTCTTPNRNISWSHLLWHDTLMCSALWIISMIWRRGNTTTGAWFENPEELCWDEFCVDFCQKLCRFTTVLVTCIYK